MALRVINRVIVFDRRNERMLLVRNRGANFWYAPGGGWNYQKEDLANGAIREICEEVGIQVRISHILYVRPFQPASNVMQLEIFWLAAPMRVTLPKYHIDRHGLVEEARWFKQPELHALRVFPERLKIAFWETDIHNSFNCYLDK